MPVSEVTAADVLAILTPIWHDKPEMGLIRFGGYLPKGEYDVDHDGDEGQAVAAELHG